MTTIGEIVPVMNYTVPPLYERHHPQDPLTIEEWHVSVGDIIQPDQLLVSLGTPPGFCDVYSPEELSGDHRIVFLPTPDEEILHLGDLLIQLQREPVSVNEPQ